MSSSNKDEIPRTSVADSIDHAIQHGKDKQGPSEADAHITRVKSKTVDKPVEKPVNGDSGPDDDTLKIIGGVVAVVAAIALGVTIKKKRSGGKKEKAQEESQNFLDKAGNSLGWIGNKAEHGADKAGSKASGAASTTKDKASEIIPQPISDAASSIKENLNVTGIKAEREGLKASEKSDAAVRDAADKLIHNTDKAGKKADNKSGGFFSGFGNWGKK